MDKRNFRKAMEEWVALSPAINVPFETQAQLLVNTRLAADMAGATRMDRPERGAIDPVTGEIYFTLTRNSSRTAAQVSASNPRGPNPFGHIIRWADGRGNLGRGRGNHYSYDKLVFEWDISVLAGPPEDSWVDNAETGEIKRFFISVPGCEVTGVVSTPDAKTLFVNLQHPGEQSSRLLPKGYTSA